MGEVLHAFNMAQASFFLIFQRLLDPRDYELALKVWHSQSSDSAQRAMLEPFVVARVRRKSIQSGLLWAMRAVNELSVVRNDAVHAEMLWYYDELIPGVSTKQERQRRLLALPLEKSWRKLRGDFWAIYHYVSDLELDLMFENSRPSTKRPRLLLARTKSPEAQAKRSRAKKAAHERRRQSSRA